VAKVQASTITTLVSGLPPTIVAIAAAPAPPTLFFLLADDTPSLFLPYHKTSNG
jgi:hypothetical protein